MKTYLECIPCFVRQTNEILRNTIDNDKDRWEIMQQVLRDLADYDFRVSPPEAATRIHRLIRKKTGLEDPYREAKRRSNEIALQLYPELKTRIKTSLDPWETALRLAIAGNIIDLGIKNEVNLSDIERSIEDALRQPLTDGNAAKMKADVEAAGNILYIGDNAGEIVFDRLFIEEMPTEKVTFVVRGYPAINDALMEDAEAVGLTDIVNVIDNGSDAPGTLLADCSSEFLRAFKNADLIIAKGQGNYETLSDVPKPIYFLFRVKCHVIAYDAGIEVGKIAVIKRGEGKYV